MIRSGFAAAAAAATVANTHFVGSSQSCAQFGRTRQPVSPTMPTRPRRFAGAGTATPAMATAVAPSASASAQTRSGKPSAGAARSVMAIATPSTAASGQAGSVTTARASAPPPATYCVQLARTSACADVARPTNSAAATAGTIQRMKRPPLHGRAAGRPLTVMPPHAPRRQGSSRLRRREAGGECTRQGTTKWNTMLSLG